ncbi:MAG TPA: PTS glucose transporter subunit IIA [Candidatus Onthocola gallistercoris]|uniref:PTS glucose transporter subunit IIA n=1 Tax=Candidatus Onthocola gallistercoris TaxID=2840876 RepID=A0A9D1HIP7_9FIRM|nr:PTS glucose transporter subunit IIA [Candidatus Onthocola gallistercoris]
MFGFGKRDPLPAGSIAAAASGEIIPLEKVKDEVFARKMMGDGVAIIPSEDDIVAPCDGIVSMLYPTLHAFGITSADGLDILVHIGIDTVRLKGKGFRSFVKEGQKVRVGERIIKVDTYDMKNKGLDLTTMILFPDCSARMAMKREGYANKGKTIIATYTL